jgi:hypothetical protein
MVKSAQDRRVHTHSTHGACGDRDLDTLLIALYVELTDWIIPTLRPPRRAGPGRPPTVTDAELVCVAVAHVLLRYNDEHHWLRAAPSRVGHLFPQLLSQPEYNRRRRGAADVLEATLRWLAARPRPLENCCGWWTARPCPVERRRLPHGGRTCSATPATADRASLRTSDPARARRRHVRRPTSADSGDVDANPILLLRALAVGHLVGPALSVAVVEVGPPIELVICGTGT